MKKNLALTVILFTCYVTIWAQHPYEDPNWEVIFTDDFSGNTLNSNIWTAKEGHIHGTGNKEEPQVYKAANVMVQGGKAVLTTKRENCAHPNNNSCYYYNGIHNFTSGEIITNDRYSYGYYEVLCKMPTGQGYWPAFWMWGRGNLDTSYVENEIDIIEITGCNPDSITMNEHLIYHLSGWWPIYITDRYHSPDTQKVSFTVDDGYHWYGVEWDEDYIVWYADRKEIRREKNNIAGLGIHHPLKIILNVALIPEGWGSNHPCLAGESTVCPQSMLIDQFNAYKLKCDVNTIVNEIYDFNSFYFGVKKSITMSGNTTIPSYSNISLRAKEFIQLNAGFEVPLGSELYLGTCPCNYLNEYFY